MSVTFRDAGTTTSYATSPRSVNKGTQVAGDTLILAVHLGTTGEPTSIPSGFTLINSFVGASQSIWLYQKISTGASEPASYSVSFASGSGVLTLLVCYSSSGYSLAIDDFAGQENASSANRDWPSVTTEFADDLLACFGFILGNFGSTPDALMTERIDNSSGFRNYLMTQTVAAIGATGTRTATGTAAASLCVSLAINEIPPVPADPSGLSATAISASRIDLSWTDNSSNESGFVVERSPNGSTGWTQVGTPAANATTFSNTGLSSNTTYYYRVKATNAGGDSAYTSTASATTLDVAPSAPSGLTATAVSKQQINLTWTDNSNNELNFELERSLDGVSGWSLVTSPAANATSYNNTGRSPLTRYYYRIRAVNAIGNSAWSSVANALTFPSTPQNLIASAPGARRVVLVWDDLDEDVDGYQIEHSSDGLTGWTFLAGVAQGVGEYTHSGLAPESSHYYRIRAYKD